MKRARVVLSIIASAIISSAITAEVVSHLAMKKIENLEAFSSVFTKTNEVAEIVAVVAYYLNDENASKEYSYISMENLSKQFDREDTKEISVKLKELSSIMKDETKDDVSAYWRDNVVPELTKHFKGVEDQIKEKL